MAVNIKSLRAVVGICIFLLLSHPIFAAEAPSIETLIPEGALVCFSIANGAEFKGQLKTTGLYKIYKEEQVQRFIKEGFPLAGALKGEFGSQTGLISADIKSIAKGELAIALLGMDFSGPVPLIEGLLIADTSPNPDEWREFIRKRIEGNPIISRYSYNDVEINLVKKNGIDIASFAFVGDYFVAGGEGRMPVESFIDMCKQQKQAPLDSNPLYKQTKAALTEIISEPAYYAYVDSNAVIGSFMKVLPPMAGSFIDKLGLSGMKAVGFAGTVEGSGFRDVMFINMPGEKPGIFAAYSDKPVDEALLKKIPAGVGSFQISNVHLDKLYASIINAANSIIPAPAAPDAAIKEFETKVGFTIEGDLLGSLGTEMIMYSFLPKLGEVSLMKAGGFMEQVFMIEVRDKAGIEDCIARMKQYVEGLALSAPEVQETIPQPGIKAPSLKNIDFVDKEYNGKVIHIISAGAPGGFQLAYTFKDKYIIAASRDDSIRRALDAADNPGPSILESKDFTDCIAHLPGVRTGLAYWDLRSYFSFIYGIIVPIMKLQLGAQAASTVKLDLLPDGEVISRNLFAMVSTNSYNEKGLYSQSFGPVSSTMTLAGIGAGAATVTPFLLTKKRAGGLALPGEAGGFAGKEKIKIARPLSPSEKNLQNIGLALHLYATVNNDKFPEKLSDLVPDYVRDEALLKAPGWEGKAGIGYEYVKGFTFSLQSDKIIVYEKKELRQGGRYVLYVNGNIEFLSEEKFQGRMGLEE